MHAQSFLRNTKFSQEVVFFAKPCQHLLARGVPFQQGVAHGDDRWQVKTPTARLHPIFPKSLKPPVEGENAAF